MQKSLVLLQEHCAELKSVKIFFTADTLEKILVTLDVTPQDLFMINYLKPQEDLVNEIIQTVQSIKEQ